MNGSTASLCHVCQEVLSLSRVDPSRNHILSHHSSITDFLCAARERCHFCWRGYRLLKPSTRLGLDELASKEALRGQLGLDVPAEATVNSVVNGTRWGTEIFWEIIRFRTDGLPTISLSLSINGISHQSAFIQQVLFFIPTKGMSDIYEAMTPSPALLTRFSPQGSLPPNKGLSTALDTVLGWLNRCTSGHAKCRVSETPHEFRPTRLVDIESVKGLACIVAGDRMPQQERYVTLSHRWGSQNKILLTTKNKEELGLGLPINHLSQTFQDAISVARYMGIRFLWIDCLCIIQAGDNGRDWESESGRMNDIYRHAYFNISADYGSGDEGLFFDREPSFYSQVEIQTLGQDGDEVVDWTSVDKDMWRIEVNNSPLSNRGWVFQERILSPRVVHFCRQEIFWECHEKFYCESFPENLPPAPLLDLNCVVSLRQTPLELWDGSPWLGVENFPVEDLPYEVWDDIVKAYTGCEFTYPDDKLAAISGIARHHKLYIKDVYLAGMWQKRLSAELGWWMYSHRQRYVLGEEPRYYAPSFSWASVKGKINSHGPFAIGILVKVACVTLESRALAAEGDVPFTQDEFGVSLRSPVFQLRVTGRLRSVRLQKLGRWRLTLPILYHVGGGKDKESSVPNEPFSVQLKPWLDFTVSDSDCAEFGLRPYYIMYWRYGPQPGDYNMDKAELHCMLLSLVDEARHRFRRIGWVIVASKPDANIMMGDRTEQGLPGLLDEEEGLHTIYII
ncbi:HET-domain-containing protein [Thozetella sp. PMI_491]|nr:HET-domain-containing protein [Thozetella sp. PMI_491]